LVKQKRQNHAENLGAVRSRAVALIVGAPTPTNFAIVELHRRLDRWIDMIMLPAVGESGIARAAKIQGFRGAKQWAAGAKPEKLRQDKPENSGRS